MKLEAQKRSDGKAAALRREDRLPAIVYNSGLNLMVSVDRRAFDKVFRTQGTSSIIDLDVDGAVHAVLVKQVQMDKRLRTPQHIDFYAVTEGQLVDVHVPIEITGTARGQREGGMLDIHRREVHIEIMPRLIPNNLSVDVSALAIGDSIHVADIAELLPAEARILDELDRTILTVVPPRLAEAEETEAAEEAAEPEVISRGGEEDEDTSPDGE